MLFTLSKEALNGRDTSSFNSIDPIGISPVIGSGLSAIVKLGNTVFKTCVLKIVQNTKLSNIIISMHRPGAKIGSGSTADAIRHEIRTGQLLSRKGHFEKGNNLIRGLGNLITSGNLSRVNKLIARHYMRDLKNALAGK